MKLFRFRAGLFDLDSPVCAACQLRRALATPSWSSGRRHYTTTTLEQRRPAVRRRQYAADATTLGGRPVQPVFQVRVSRAITDVQRSSHEAAGIQHRGTFRPSSHDSPQDAPISHVRAGLRAWLARAKENAPPDTGIPAFIATELNDNSLSRPLPAGMVSVMHVDEALELRNPVEELQALESAEFEAPATQLATLSAGDVVELGVVLPTFPMFAVYLGMSSGGICQFLTITGDFYFQHSTAIKLRIPSYFDAEDLEPVHEALTQLYDEGSLQRQGESKRVQRAPHLLNSVAVRKLRLLWSKTREFYLHHFEYLDKVHHKLARETTFSLHAVADIADECVGEPPRGQSHAAEAIFGVHWGLTRHNFGFISIESQADANNAIVAAYPKDAIASSFRLLGWVRSHREAMSLRAIELEVPERMEAESRIITDFVDKATRLAGLMAPAFEYTKDGLPYAYNSEFQGVDQVVEFTPEETEIIRTMKLFAQGNYRPPIALTAALNSVLQAVNAKVDRPYESHRHFLISIGAISADATLLPFDTVAFDSDDLEGHLAEAKAALDAGASVADAYGLRTDALAHLRTDWNDLPVYCIDQPGAIRDDGLSIEPADANGNHWLHAHIAHPSAVLDPGSWLARMAEGRAAKLYLRSGRAVDMLPYALAQLLQIRPGGNVLTFSAQISAAGDMVDYKIQAGRVHNVKVLSRTELDTLMDTVMPVAEDFTVQVGQKSESIFPDPDVPDNAKMTTEDEPALRQMYKVAQSVIRKFPGSMLSRIDNDEVSNQVYATAPDWTPLTLKTPHTLAIRPARKANPYVNLSFSKQRFRAGAGHKTVEACMNLACIVAGRWAHDRAVPVIYDGTIGEVGGLKALVEHAVTPDGAPAGRIRLAGVPTAALLRLLALADSSVRPILAAPFATRYYCRATSPLRRYKDLVAAWQIDAALLQEHDAGRVDAAALPWTHDSLERGLNFLRAQLTLGGIFAGHEKSHWTFQALMRAFYSGEQQLPKTYVFVRDAASAYDYRHNAAAYVCAGKIAGLGLRGYVRSPAGPLGPVHDIQVGERWEVSISEISAELRRIYLVPVRRLDEPAGGELAIRLASEPESVPEPRPVPAAASAV